MLDLERNHHPENKHQDAELGKWDEEDQGRPKPTPVIAEQETALL